MGHRGLLFSCRAEVVRGMPTPLDCYQGGDCPGDSYKWNSHLLTKTTLTSIPPQWHRPEVLSHQRCRPHPKAAGAAHARAASRWKVARSAREAECPATCSSVRSLQARSRSCMRVSFFYELARSGTARNRCPLVPLSSLSQVARCVGTTQRDAHFADAAARYPALDQPVVY